MFANFITPAVGTILASAARLSCRWRLIRSFWGTKTGRNVRSAKEFEIVRGLIAAGLNDCAISRQTGIPRRTVHVWRTRSPRWDRKQQSGVCAGAHDFDNLPASDYCYLLGLYLGDGFISNAGRAWMLRITCDTQYPGIINGCRRVIDTLMPGQRAGVWTRPSGTCADVYLYSKHWPCLFPQHEPASSTAGRSHWSRGKSNSSSKHPRTSSAD